MTRDLPARLTKSLLFVLPGVLLWVLPNQADAYLTRASFAQDVEEGGGGGRYFTGSPLDQQGCGSCHTGGSDETGLFFALPLPEAYEAGQAYNIAVQWAQGPGVSAGSLEVVNANGRGIGTIEIVEEQASQCNTTGREGELATSLQTDDLNNRTIAGTDACGAFLLNVVWTAPLDPSGQAFVYASAVLAGTEEGQGQPAGDTDDALRALIPPAGEGGNVSNIGRGCSATDTQSPASALGLLFLLGLSLAARRRKQSSNPSLQQSSR